MAGMSRIPNELAAEMTPAVRAFVDALLKRIDDLEARVGKTPQNSSLPPQHAVSACQPEGSANQVEEEARWAAGASEVERPLIPAEKCSEAVTVKPKDYRRCGTKLTGSDEQSLRHQAWELPEIQPIITEYQQHRLTCRCYRESTCAALPAGVPSGQSGP